MYIVSQSADPYFIGGRPVSVDKRLKSGATFTLIVFRNMRGWGQNITHNFFVQAFPYQEGSNLHASDSVFRILVFEERLKFAFLFSGSGTR